MKRVYILLSRTETSVAKIIFDFTKGEFTHTSISLKPTTSDFHSFARKIKWTFLVAGYVKEDIHTFVFAKYQHCHCGLFALDVTDEAYEKMSEIIEDISTHKKHYKYNLLGTISVIFNKKVPFKRRYNCAQFVAKVLDESGAAKLPCDPSMMRPMDFTKISGIRQIYSGTIGECNLDNDI